MRFMNSGENLRFAASTATLEILRSISRNCSGPGLGAKPIPPEASRVISLAPRFDVIKTIVREKSTLRLSPSVSVALSRIPSNNCHSASLAFSISSNSTRLSFKVSVW